MHGINCFLGFTAGLVVLIVLVHAAMYLSMASSAIQVAP